jgi:hypothetical protein
MQHRTRALIASLVLLSLTSGCSEPTQTTESSSASSTTSVTDDDLASRIIELFDDDDRLERTSELVSILRNVKPGQGAALEAALDGLDTTNRELDQVLIVAAWSNIDPVAASRWVLRNARQELVRFGMLNECIYKWALQDPEGLIRDPDILLYSQKGWDATSIRALVRGWYQSGKPGLEDFVYGLPATGEDRQRAVSELIATKLDHEGVEPVIEWATNSMRGEFPFRQYIYSRLAGDIAKIDPQRAIEWCNEVCDTKLGQEIPLWIATTWVVDGGAEAMDWIIARDSSVVANRIGARAAYRRFLLNDQAGALAWMENSPEEARTDYETMQGPLFMYVNEKSGLGFHQQAIEWTKYIDGESERDELLMRIARRWLRQDPDAAEVWLADAPLSEDQKMEARQPKLHKGGATGGGQGWGPRDRLLN